MVMPYVLRSARFWNLGIFFFICFGCSNKVAKSEKYFTDDDYEGIRYYDVNNRVISSNEYEVDISINDQISYVHNVLPTFRPLRANCTAPAIEQFPKPLVRPRLRVHGGLIIHILLAIFAFLGLTIVCDKYFLGSIERLCEVLKLTPDVAGATFMAIGSSAPELAFCLIGLFIAKDDVGISSVIGSTVFNSTTVIAICALCSGTVCLVNWWPLLRDCTFYIFSILGLFLVIFNDVISGYGSCVLCLSYFGYLIVLQCKAPLKRWPISLFTSKKIDATLEASKTESNNSPTVDNLEQQHKTDLYQPEVVIVEKAVTAEGKMLLFPNLAEFQTPAWANPAAFDIPTVEQAVEQAETHPQGTSSVESRELTLSHYIYWLAIYPITVLAKLTIPDCQLQQYRTKYLLTFFMSFMWIMFYSYILIWMVTIIGNTLGLPDAFMRHTFVAAAFSVPKILNATFACKKGLGNMAISSAIGSNIFIILVCLGLPWFIQSVIINPFSYVYMEHKGFIYTAFLILSTVVFLMIAMYFNGFKLNKRLGITLVTWHTTIIILAVSYELNIFGTFNPVQCISDY